MNQLHYGTHYIMEDEPALLLVEMNLLSPDCRERRRYQIIQVIRNDKPTEYREDLGLTENFQADQMRILGGVIDSFTGKIWIEHTVGELKEIADKLRGNSPFNKQELARSQSIKEG
mgnify:CR=1 FL=1